MALVAPREGASAAERPQRDDRGRYVTERNPIVLFEIVREVARIAARRDPDPLKDPATVSQSAWNAARALASEYGHIPQANEICRQLCDRDGNPWPWRELLTLVLDERRDPKKTWEERLSEQDRPVTEDHVGFALKYVALQLEDQTQLRFVHTYEETREQLLRDAKANGASVQALKQRLPTRGQIETVCDGNWVRALELAGLLPPTSDDDEGAVAIVEALLRFYAAEGYLPTQVELAEAARDQGVRLERAVGRWLDYVEEAEREADRRHLPKPPAYGTRPLAGRQGPPSRRGESPATKGIYTRVHVLERVREFVAGLPAATSPTNKQWREFQRGRAGVPSLNVIRRHGSLNELVHEASRADWRERAEEWDREALPIPRYRGGRPRKDTGERIEAVIRERGEASAREIAEALNETLDVVRYFVRQLKDADRIKPMHAYTQARNQRYRLASGEPSE